MEYEEDFKSEKTAQFNSSIAILQRLDLLWKDAHNHSRHGQFEKWNLDLDRVWVELVANAKEDDVKKIEDINKIIAVMNMEKKITNTGDLIYPNKNEIYDLITKKEILLKHIENKQGKGTKMVDADEEWFD